MNDPSCVGSAQRPTEKGRVGIRRATRRTARLFLPAPAQGQPEDAKKLRRGAKLVVIFLSDAGDQSNREAEYASGNPPTDANDGPWWDPNLPAWTEIYDQIGKRPDLDGIMAGAILCSGNNCGEAKNPSLYDLLVQQTSGIQGLITDNASVDATMQAIVDATIGATGLALSKPPISASLKVVQDNPPAGCPQPRRAPGRRVRLRRRLQPISFFGATARRSPAARSLSRTGTGST